MPESSSVFLKNSSSLAKPRKKITTTSLTEEGHFNDVVIKVDAASSSSNMYVLGIVKLLPITTCFFLLCATVNLDVTAAEVPSFNLSGTDDTPIIRLKSGDPLSYVFKGS